MIPKKAVEAEYVAAFTMERHCPAPPITTWPFPDIAWAIATSREYVWRESSPEACPRIKRRW